MKKIMTFLTGITSLLISFTSGAQPETGYGDKSLLWSITGKGMAKPSYLFGTIHLICQEDYLWTDKMKESFDKSEKVCFEMDLDDPDIAMQTALGLISHTGKKLSDYFTPEQYQILTRYAKDSLGLDIVIFEQMKPAALLSIMGASDISCPNPISYEDSLLKTAGLANKEVLGLEKVQEQIDVLESIPSDTVVQQLMDQIQNPITNDTEFNQLVAAYKTQDLPALYALLTSNKDLSTDMGVFLDERNKKWIPRIANKMKVSSVFFAVGAGHLYGPAGVISLLRKDGYKVVPVR